MIEKKYAVRKDSTSEFINNAFFCIGTGRMGLALQQEYLDELKTMQKMAAFSHIRGHGLFCDDMAVYDPYTDKDGNTVEHYNFTYLDRVFDSYLKLGLRPFIELGFMPQKMASGTQTIFYWKGNTTPPQDSTKWQSLIRAFVSHLIERYGENEVASWPVEVWNEPNLPGFWQNADLSAYLELYRASVTAVKEVLPRMRVGGPAVCGGDKCLPWIRAFLDFCLKEHLPVDFVTRHIYMAQTPERIGRYIYHDMCSPAYSIHEAEETRELIDSYPKYRGIELHITEFNTSYNPRCPTHDTIYNGSLICGMLAGLGKYCASYSYWTFGDVFEEVGVYDREFHGGFGLIADRCIPKPTAWAYHFFKRLNGTPLFNTDDMLCVQDRDGTFRILIWNICAQQKEQRTFDILLPGTSGTEYSILCETVDRDHGNPLKVWHDLGEPAVLSDCEAEILRRHAVPETVSSRTVAGPDGISVNRTLSPNAFSLITIRPLSEASFSPGYNYPAGENE